MQQAVAGYEQALHEKAPTRPRALTMTRQLRAVTWLSHTSVSEVLQRPMRPEDLLHLSSLRSSITCSP